MEWLGGPLIRDAMANETSKIVEAALFASRDAAERALLTESAVARAASAGGFGVTAKGARAAGKKARNPRLFSRTASTSHLQPTGARAKRRVSADGGGACADHECLLPASTAPLRDCTPRRIFNTQLSRGSPGASTDRVGLRTSSPQKGVSVGRLVDAAAVAAATAAYAEEEASVVSPFQFEREILFLPSEPLAARLARAFFELIFADARAFS